MEEQYSHQSQESKTMKGCVIILIIILCIVFNRIVLRSLSFLPEKPCKSQERIERERESRCPLRAVELNQTATGLHLHLHWTELTHAGWQWSVPHSPVTTQTGQSIGAVHSIARVTAILNHRICEVAFVPDPIAIAGNSWILTFHQVKTYEK